MFATFENNEPVCLVESYCVERSFHAQLARSGLARYVLKPPQNRTPDATPLILRSDVDGTQLRLFRNDRAKAYDNVDPVHSDHD